MGADWTGGPAKWAAVAVLGAASVAGMTWSIAARQPRASGNSIPRQEIAQPRGDEARRPAPMAATPAEHLVDGDRGKDARGLSPEDVSRMEHEMESLGREFKLIEESHGKNVLNLVLVVGYLRKLLDNPRVLRYLTQHQPEIRAEFQKLVESRSLADGDQKKAASE